MCLWSTRIVVAPSGGRKQQIASNVLRGAQDMETYDMTKKTPKMVTSRCP